MIAATEKHTPLEKRVERSNDGTGSRDGILSTRERNRVTATLTPADRIPVVTVVTCTVPFGKGGADEQSGHSLRCVFHGVAKGAAEEGVWLDLAHG